MGTEDRGLKIVDWRVGTAESGLESGNWRKGYCRGVTAEWALESGTEKRGQKRGNWGLESGLGVGGE